MLQGMYRNIYLIGDIGLFKGSAAFEPSALLLC
jgi:hypothetical protein